jgi:hypothetical protein
MVLLHCAGAAGVAALGASFAAVAGRLGALCGQAAFIVLLPYVPLARALAAAGGGGLLPKVAALFLGVRQGLHLVRLAVNLKPAVGYGLAFVRGRRRVVGGGAREGGLRGAAQGPLFNLNEAQLRAQARTHEP